jgi:hypothetical protein
MSYYNLPEIQFRPWFANMVTTAVANAATLGLSPLQVTQFNTILTNYQAAVAAQTAARDAAKAATETKNVRYQEAYALTQLWANQWQVDPAVSDTLKIQLGLNIRDNIPSPRPIFPVTQLSGTGNSVGTVRLRWNRNGNAQGCTFFVQARQAGGDWTLVTATTRTRLALGNQELVPTEYRVVTERRGQTSEPSDAVVVYGEGAAPSLQILKAA